MAKIGVFKLFINFLILGCTSFGGPIAHLGYFRERFVSRLKILDEAHYLQLVSFCQLLPGPTSSQVSMLIGLTTNGLIGAFVAWLAFLTPSAIILSIFGFSIHYITNLTHAGWIHGLKLVALAVVLQACWFMAKNFCQSRITISIMAIASAICICAPNALGQISCLVGGAIAGLFFLNPVVSATSTVHFIKLPAWLSGLSLLIFIFLLGNAFWIDHNTNLWSVCLGFFRAGALVFGGGHVVLPLLQQFNVPYLVSNNIFLAGYGAAQAMPGPLFSFAAYLGSVANLSGSAWLHAILFTLAIYLPSFLLVLALFPYWQKIQHNFRISKLVQGINASVVGVLLAALYNPIFTASVMNNTDFAFAVVAFVLLQYWKIPMWLLVIVGAIAGQVLVIA